MRKSEERKLQITSKSYFDYALPGVLAFHISNEAYFGEDRQRAIIQMALLKKMGFLPGVPDWLLFWGQQRMHGDVPYVTPKMAAIELKTEKGTLSQSQIDFQTKWTNLGGKYAVCRSMEEIQEAVVAWGLKPLYPVPVALAESRRQMRQYAAFEFFKPLEPRLPRVNLTTK
jgi:hypothetical protein